MNTVNLYFIKLVLLLALLSPSAAAFAQSSPPPDNSFSNPKALNVTDLINFSGKWQTNKVNLDCKLAQDHTITRVYIEHGTSVSSFERIGEMTTSGTAGFRFTDANAASGKNFYRLVLYETNNSFAYSKVLKIDNETSTKLSLQVYPTVVSGSATVSIISETPYKGTLQIADMSGHILSQRAIAVQQGTMITDLRETNTLAPGTYMVILHSDTERLVQRIIVPK